MHFFYVQDDWKVSTKLTLNLGVRYEYATPQYEADNHLSNFDPSGPKLVSASNGDMFHRALVHPDKNNFAPRVGLAYAVGAKTVIRNGYGISYIHFNRLGGENLLAYNPPSVIDVGINNPSPLTSQMCAQGVASPASTIRRRDASTEQDSKDGARTPGVHLDYDAERIKRLS